MGYTSETKVSLPMTICAMGTTESMVGVSENMVSLTTVSFLHGMLKDGNLDLKHFS